MIPDFYAFLLDTLVFFLGAVLAVGACVRVADFLSRLTERGR